MHNIAIIGSGPAGYTAGIYASRANLEPVLFEGLESGGQLMLTTDVENYPGFDSGIMGPDLMQIFKKQAERFGTQIKTETIKKVQKVDKGFRLESGKDVYEFKSVIISSGASAKWLNIKGEKELQGHGVSACATCDGFFFKEKEVIVVGGGDSAMEEALFLTKFAFFCFHDVSPDHNDWHLHARREVISKVRSKLQEVGPNGSTEGPHSNDELVQAAILADKSSVHMRIRSVSSRLSSWPRRA